MWTTSFDGLNKISVLTESFFSNGKSIKRYSAVRLSSYFFVLFMNVC